MTELELLIDFHKDAERQGPGSTADTLRALSSMDFDRDQHLSIADIGCGTGAQTMTLAQNVEGQITAVDLFPQFLDKLQANARTLGLEDKISTLEHSMEELPFEEESFDIIWSEGAIYIMGFEAGIKQWRRFLKPGGYLAVSEITWLTHERPREIEAYWEEAYPEIGTASDKIGQLEANGYMPIGYFPLPVSSWTDHYYGPIEDRMEAFLSKHKHAAEATALVDQERNDIKKYKAYKDYFSYGFYIAQKV
jgi:SAM-dependent methyltransferase